MTPRQLLSPQARAALFDPPTDVRAIVRYYTFSTEDVSLIRQRRRNANRLGFAVHLAYLRFPGRVLGPKETPPAYMLAFIADQLRIDPDGFADYAQGGETRGSTSKSCRPILRFSRYVATNHGPDRFQRVDWYRPW